MEGYSIREQLKLKNTMETLVRTRSHTRRTQRDYSMPFKLKVVNDVESGKRSIRQAALEYGIQAPSTVSEWVRRYGVLNGEQRAAVEFPPGKSPEERLMEVESRVRLLEKQRELMEERMGVLQGKAAKLDMITEITLDRHVE